MIVVSVLVVFAMLLSACAQTAATTAPAATEAAAATTAAPAAAATTAVPAATEVPTETPLPTFAPAKAGVTVLNVWSFTNEIKTMAVAFEKVHPDVQVNYTMIPMTNGEYQTKLMATLGTGNEPDVVALEASFVKSYVESDFLADLKDLAPDAAADKTYQEVIDVGTYKGVTKAYSYQSTPGALFYRRSLAKSYFGTDDPTKIQALLSDMDKFTAAAKVVHDKSSGKTFMVASSGDFMNLYYANRAQPWVVANTLTIDPMVEKMVQTAKTFRDNGFEAQATQWGEGWFAGMNDSLKDASGTKEQVFCYLLPTWGLPYTLSPNATTADKSSTTVGDWAMITGPLPYQWGGTWMGVMKATKQQKLAEEFVRFATLDQTNLTNWATGVYTNEYLKAIDPTVPDSQAQAGGDFVSSQVVVEKITKGFDKSTLSDFLGGENSYGAFAAAAPNVSAKLMQGSDDSIQRALNDPLNAYLAGTTTEDQMWSAFKDAVRTEYPDLTVK